MKDIEVHEIDILLVAMGTPLQEKWIGDHIKGGEARLVFGVGALFDFVAQEVNRAPLTFRQLRLEWVYRLAQEPRRLWKRYLLGNPVFMLRLFKQRLKISRQN